MKTIYKSLVLTLLLICGNTYATGVYYTINGSEDITFKKGAEIYIDFSQVTTVTVTRIQLDNMGCNAEEHLPTYVKLTFNQDFTINISNNNGAGFQWEENNKQWTHSGGQWAKFLSLGKCLPFPAAGSDCNCIRVTYDGSSAPTYTWISDYTPGGAGGGGGGAGGAGGETGVGGGSISVSEATGNGTISEAAGCEGCYKTTFVEK